MLIQAYYAYWHLTAMVSCCNLKETSLHMLLDSGLSKALAGQHAQDACVSVWFRTLFVSCAMDAKPLTATVVIHLSPMCFGDNDDIVFFRGFSGVAPCHEFLCHGS